MVAHGDRAGPTGQELLAEFQQYGHQQPFEEIVRRYAGMVFNVCLRVTKDKHDAEDATQAVFLTLALQAKRGTEIKALGPWLQQVGKRLSLDIRRSKKRRKTREERHHDEQTHRIDSMLTDRIPGPDLDELKTILNEELQKLPTKYRLPLILHYYGGMSRDEMAVELNCKASTLGVRIFRGREMLAGRLSGRGVAITAGALAVAMSYAVKHAIAEGLITSTSHAAVSIAAGHTGAGLASASVMGLTRHAGGALTASKIKLLTATLVLASTSLGATAQAIGLLPQINVQKILTEQVRRMVQPLFKPVTRSMVRAVRADANTASPATVGVAVAPVPSVSIDNHTAGPAVSTVPVAVAVAKTPSTADTSSSHPTAASSTWGSDFWSGNTVAIVPVACSRDATTDSASDDGSMSMGASSGGSMFGDSVTGSALYSVPSSAGHFTNLSIEFPVSVTATANSLTIPVPKLSLAQTATAVKAVVAAGAKSTALGPVTYGSIFTADPAESVYSIPALNGVVTESDGVLRGYGTLTATGTLTTSGAVVADGYGIDRTLDLSQITNLISTGNPTGLAGWYASDKGRITLPLLPATSPVGGGGLAYVWGDDPSDTVPTLGNSVRLILDPAGSIALTRGPATLSLLSVDRGDVPSLSTLGGAPIGLWQVDPSYGDIASADLTVAFNQLLVDELGASGCTAMLWTLDGTAGGSGQTWMPLTTSSFVYDSIDHTVAGHATDFDYFAVTVDAPAGADLNQLAHPLTESISGAGPSAVGTAVVPEPASAVFLLSTIPLLARRRRRSAGVC